MTEEELEQERLKCVFCLGGGELHEPSEKFPDEFDGLGLGWYEGRPDGFDATAPDWECRTVIYYMNHPEKPDGWKYLGHWMSSGEMECWWCGDGTGNEYTRETCKLCEGDGLIYIGDGYGEAVYQIDSEEHYEGN